MYFLLKAFSDMPWLSLIFNIVFHSGTLDQILKNMMIEPDPTRSSKDKDYRQSSFSNFLEGKL